jgi:hypothetical protein
MKIPESLMAMSSVEVILLVLFVIYIVFPFKTANYLLPVVNSMVGIILLFCATVIMFSYTNPIVGVVFLFVLYELIRRSSETYGNANAIIMEYTPSQQNKDNSLKQMNPAKNVPTVEEEVIAQRAPINAVPVTELVQTSFKPVAEPIKGGSSYNSM